MTTATAHKIVPGIGITCHAWNKDRTMVALCPNSSIVQIFKAPALSDPKGKWELAHELKEHDQVVMGIDWAPNTNQIVTTSQDRNAYVWVYEEVDGKMAWRPSLVILRVNRAATHVKWNKEETKFAVGSGSRCVPVCYYDEEQKWWVSKIVKKHKSTVLDLDWHPNLPVLATASSDFKCRIFSAVIKDYDPKGCGKGTIFGDSLGFGQVLQEFPCAGWVHSVRWSPSGKYLSFAGHDSTISFVTVTGPDSAAQTIKMPNLPFRDLLFLSDSAVVGAGFELNPIVFTEDGGKWGMKGRLDSAEKKDDTQPQSQAKAAFAIFQNQAKRGGTGSSAASAELSTKHQNTINSIVPLSASGGDVTEFTSAGLDGILVHWKLDSLEASLSKLQI